MNSQFKIAQTAGWTVSLAAHLGLGWALLSAVPLDAPAGKEASDVPGIQVVLVDTRSAKASAGQFDETASSLDSPPPFVPALDGETTTADLTSSGAEGGQADGAPAPSGVSGASAERSFAGAADFDAFQRRLLEHITRYKTAPGGQAAPAKPVLVRFVLQKDGSVSNAWIYASSGHQSFDAAALRTVDRAQPLPSPPAGLPDPLNVVLPVPFVNQGG